MNNVAVVGITGIVFLTFHDLDVVVYQDRVGDTRDLSNLISDIQVLIHELLAGQ